MLFFHCRDQIIHVTHEDDVQPFGSRYLPLFINVKGAPFVISPELLKQMAY